MLARRSGLLPACPWCGKAPQPLWDRVGRNRLSAVFAMAALALLVWSMALPFLSMTRFNQTREFTLVGGILELWRTGSPLIATVLFIFSVLFPVAKLLGILLATSRMVRWSVASRRKLVWLSVVSGKYSLLDVLVLAVMIVLVRFEHVAEMRAGWGVAPFCVAIVLSVFSGLLVRIDPEVA